MIEMVDTKVIDDLVAQIVQTVRPQKIFLFGSAARGQMGPDSDIDVMVVVPDGTHCLKMTQHLYKQLFGFGYPVDILVTTPAVLERHRHNKGLIYRNVLAEGREVYAA
ncbi:MAG TPA: nucleotidyltransferase domain-containing protein [Anaerolineae bacterium]|nr:nucleotidyltransferase domain-containing protein [Anaerolineae bacterium]HQI85346.1 nucleotidyltransferase domain-containing protein [Anaerolineae bacterium]